MKYAKVLGITGQNLFDKPEGKVVGELPKGAVVSIESGAVQGFGQPWVVVKSQNGKLAGWVPSVTLQLLDGQPAPPQVSQAGASLAGVAVGALFAWFALRKLGAGQPKVRRKRSRR